MRTGQGPGAALPDLSAFGRYADLVRDLILEAEIDLGDKSHDATHLVRVWRNAQRIIEGERTDPEGIATAGVDEELVAVATALHDAINVKKDDPLRSFASRLSAAHAMRVMGGRGWGGERLERLGEAIAAHSYSAGIEPRSVEAAILQDADRLDALGAVGLARMFYCSGRIDRALYDHLDPRAERRELDEDRFTIDHVETKLRSLASSFRTATGRAMARDRWPAVESFMTAFHTEIA